MRHHFRIAGYFIFKYTYDDKYDYSDNSYKHSLTKSH